VFYRMSRQRGSAPRRVSWDELAADKILRRGLRAISKLRATDELLAEGLEAAVRRTTLLHVVLPDDGRAVNWYVVNTAANQMWAERVGLANAALVPNGTTPEERPPLITMYEQNIGLVTPMILDELREAEDRYPMHWIEDAIREAVRSNARSWRYINKVLERWAAHGRQDAPGRAERPIDVDKYTNGAYGDLFRRGSDTPDG
jgi:DNA replication protein